MFFEKKDRATLLFFAALLGFVLSKGQALVPGLGLDDYSALHIDRNVMFYLWQGRFTQALVQVLMTKLGLIPTSMSFPVIILFFVFGSLAIALGILYVARQRGHTVALASVATLMASHPYLSEYFTFRESLITQGLAFALMAFVFMLARGEQPGPSLRKPGQFLATVIAMVLLAGAQQTAFLVLGFFIIARMLADHLDKPDAVTGTERNTGRPLLLAYVAAGFAYVLIYVLIKKTTDVPLDARSSLIGIADLPGRLHQIGELLGRLLFNAEEIISSPVKIYLLCVVAVLVFLVALSRPKAAVFISVFFLLILGGSILLVTISGVWWPVPRAVYGFGFALALYLLLLQLFSPASTARPYATAVSLAAIVLSFHSSAFLYDQTRLNRWDAWVAGTIAQQLMAMGASTDRPVVIVGAGWAHPIGLHTVQGDLNVSALVKPWTASDLFMETTGRQWKIDSVPSSPNCDGAGKWPASGAIKQGTDAVYVCMGQR